MLGTTERSLEMITRARRSRNRNAKESFGAGSARRIGVRYGQRSEVITSQVLIAKTHEWIGILRLPRGAGASSPLNRVTWRWRILDIETFACVTEC
jgi:hypothetical protein